jgi:hypothetical protein
MQNERAWNIKHGLVHHSCAAGEMKSDVKAD